jgi:hypothetical protein
MSLIRKSSVFAVVFLGWFVTSAHAQGIITVKVPFPFVVDNETLPAGQYEIRVVEDMGAVMAIEGMNNRSGTFALTMSAGGEDPADNQPSLVFTRDGNQYRLSQIWESRTDGRELSTRSGAGKVARSETQPKPSQVLAYVLPATWK